MWKADILRISKTIILSTILLFLECNMWQRGEVWGYTLTVTSYGGKVDFGKLAPSYSPAIIPYAAEMVIVSPGSTWDLMVSAANNLINTADANKTIPIGQLKWSPSNTTPTWNPFYTSLQTILSAQPATPAAGKALAYDYRLDINWQDRAGSYCGTLTYTVTAGLIGPSFALPNPFSPDSDGIKDTTEISYYLDVAGTITATILEGTTTIRTLLSDVIQAAGLHSVVWDGKNSSSVVVNDGQYKYLIQDNGSTVASGIITVDTTLSSGTAIVQGRIMDDANSQPLSAATVKFYETGGKQVSNITSDSSGGYVFNNIAAGYYYLEASHSLYYTKITPFFYLSQGEVVTYNIYLSHNTSLFITKEVGVKTAQKGDLIGYKINVRNIGTGRVKDIKIEDRLPYNFKYLPGTTQIDGRKALDPTGKNPFIFSVETLSGGESIILTYQVMIGIDARLADQRNSAWCFGYTEEGRVSAGPASCDIRIKEGIFRKRGIIIGKVYEDQNGDGIQQEEEKGLSKVRLVMEDGTTVITDIEGRYSIPYIKPGSHILMIDKTTLPFNNISPAKLSQLIVLPEEGISKVNFGITQSKDLHLTEEKEGFSLICLGEGELGYLAVKGNIEGFEQGNEGFAPKIYTKSRLALYLKGKIKGEYLLTTSLDTSKDEADRLYEAISPEAYYPIYGDESSLISPVTYSRLYLRIDHRESFLLHGDYQTNLSGGHFSSYERTLSGIKGYYKGTSSEVTIFRAETEQVRCRDDILGEGVSGPYYLSHYPVVNDSEIIRMERRNEETQRVISCSYQKKNVNYSIDYTEARITFVQPVPEREAGGVVYYIVAIYEYVPLGGESRHYIQGFRGELTTSNNLRIGATCISEDQSPGAFRLYGLDASFMVKLKGSLTFSSEYAQTDDNINNIITPKPKAKSAYFAEAGFDLAPKIPKIKTFYHQVGANFSNTVESTSKKETAGPNQFSPLFYDLTQLTSKKDIKAWGIKVDYQFLDRFSTSLQKRISCDNVIGDPGQITTTNKTSLIDLVYQLHQKGTIFVNRKEEKSSDDQTLPTTDSLTKITTLGASGSLNKYNLGLKYSQKDFTDYTNNNPDTITNLVASKVETRYGRLSPCLEYEFSSKYAKEDKNPLLETYNLGLSTSIEMSNKWSSSARLNYRHIDDHSAKIKTDFTVVSLLSNYTYNARTSCSARYEIIRGKSSSSNLAFTVNYRPLNSLNTHAQYTHSNPSDNSTKAVGAEFSYQPIAGINTQIKCRHNINETSGNTPQSSASNISLEMELQRKFTQGLSAYGKYSYEANRNKMGRATFSSDSKILMAIAYRPPYEDRLNLLARCEIGDSWNTIGSLEAVYNPAQRLTISGKYALRKIEYDDIISWIDLVSMQVGYGFFDRFELSGGLRLLHQHKTDDYKLNPLIELSYKADEDFRVSLGYHFISYDDGQITEADYYASGFYLKVTGKFSQW